LMNAAAVLSVSRLNHLVTIPFANASTAEGTA